MTFANDKNMHKTKNFENGDDNLQATLPKFFAFRQAIDLVRLGQDYDGGYLVSLEDLKRSDLLIGLGLCDDWSFEKDFTIINDVEVMAFDASTNYRFWIKRVIVEFIKNPFGFYGLKKFISYKRFFNGPRKHIKKFVGLNTFSSQHITLTEVLNGTKKKNIFLKIDVEGSEYLF